MPSQKARKNKLSDIARQEFTALKEVRQEQGNAEALAAAERREAECVMARGETPREARAQRNIFEQRLQGVEAFLKYIRPKARAEAKQEQRILERIVGAQSRLILN